MQRVSVLIAAVLVASATCAFPTSAQEYNPPEVSRASVGLGTAWGGLGVNYVGVGEGEKFGFNAGLGALVFGFGADRLLAWGFVFDNISACRYPDVRSSII